MSSLGDDVPARLAMAEFHIERNSYEEAIKLLESILDEGDSVTTDQLMSATALLVQAFSYIDPEKASDYAEALQEACSEAEVDGEELELMEIPRFAKKALGGEAAATSSKVRKMITSAGGKRGASHR
jgi:N-dimethylarginine dimethylaminohydrolase